MAQLFRSYESLAALADQAFVKMGETHGDCIRCEPHCDDCCHAVFGLFLVEAAYLQDRFGRLPSGEKAEAMLRCDRADRDLARVQRRLEEGGGGGEDPLAAGRVRCPLLNEARECVLYTARPITCRIYGVPTKVQGRARVCGRSGFEQGASYPAFDLDGVFRDLYDMSRELVEKAGGEDPERAGLLVSVSKVLTTPLHSLIHEPLGGPGEAP
ncbi:MAG: YkgJ family cysteine cluster protein [Deltaproteobacteria bacterium]|nr:YkgJ family cysteine cluster protein [Deltaproteobacteria bacterium]